MLFFQFFLLDLRFMTLYHMMSYDCGHIPLHHSRNNNKKQKKKKNQIKENR